MTVQKSYLQFGKIVKCLRSGRGMSQEDLANRVGLTRTSITNIEAGRQRILLDDVCVFARALSISSREMAGYVFGEGVTKEKA